MICYRKKIGFTNWKISQVNSYIMPLFYYLLLYHNLQRNTFFWVSQVLKKFSQSLFRFLRQILCLNFFLLESLLTFLTCFIKHWHKNQIKFTKSKLIPNFENQFRNEKKFIQIGFCICRGWWVPEAIGCAFSSKIQRLSAIYTLWCC